MTKLPISRPENRGCATFLLCASWGKSYANTFGHLRPPAVGPTAFGRSAPEKRRGIGRVGRAAQRALPENSDFWVRS
jgi:hypothetical protein